MGLTLPSIVAGLTVLAAAAALPADRLVAPRALAKALADPKGEKPLVLCVGFSFLYKSSHIAGAKYAGPASTPEGRQALKAEVEGLPRDKPIVLYCGCCPWTHCPNIRPAYRVLEGLGFRHVRALDLPTNFRQDWIDQNLPVERK